LKSRKAEEEIEKLLKKREYLHSEIRIGAGRKNKGGEKEESQGGGKGTTREKG